MVIAVVASRVSVVIRGVAIAVDNCGRYAAAAGLVGIADKPTSRDPVLHNRKWSSKVKVISVTWSLWHEISSKFA